MTESIPWDNLNSLEVCLISLLPSKTHTQTNKFYLSCIKKLNWGHYLLWWKVVGVVGFMDRRLDLPEGLDPQVASIIHDCWQRYFTFQPIYFLWITLSFHVELTKPFFAVIQNSVRLLKMRSREWRHYSMGLQQCRPGWAQKARVAICSTLNIQFPVVCSFVKVVQQFKGVPTDELNHKDGSFLGKKIVLRAWSFRRNYCKNL